MVVDSHNIQPTLLFNSSFTLLDGLWLMKLQIHIKSKSHFFSICTYTLHTSCTLYAEKILVWNDDMDK